MTSYNTAYGFELQTARDVKETARRVLGTTRSGRGVTPGLSTSSQPVVVELLSDLPENDYTLHAARQVEWNGSEWTFVAPIDVRKITAAAIEKGTEDEPTRLFAAVVGNLGWVVEHGTADTATTTSSTSSGTCCGCWEPDDWPSADWGAGEEPIYRQLTMPVLSCCAAAGLAILKRELDEDNWLSDPISCEDDPETTITWQLTPAGILTATHSVEGLVAQYTRNEHDTDPFCAQRFDIDEDVTPIHDRDCTICGEQVCVTPTRQYLFTECFESSQHDGNLPPAFKLTISADGFPDDVGVLPFENYGSGYLGCTYSNCNCDIGSKVLVYVEESDPETPNHWDLYATSDGGSCVHCTAGPVTGGLTPLASWTDDEFQPFGVNSGVYGNSPPTTYTLEPL